MNNALLIDTQLLLCTCTYMLLHVKGELLYLNPCMHAHNYIRALSQEKIYKSIIHTFI